MKWVKNSACPEYSGLAKLAVPIVALGYFELFVQAWWQNKNTYIIIAAFLGYVVFSALMGRGSGKKSAAKRRSYAKGSSRQQAYYQSTGDYENDYEQQRLYEEERQREYDRQLEYDRQERERERREQEREYERRREQERRYNDDY